MRTRGRHSAAELSIVTPTFGTNRPTSPDELTSEQKAVWDETVSTESAGFFNTAALRSLLAEYCRHTVASRQIATQIDAFDVAWLADDDGLKRYDLLLKI